jgi:hypothetical protein
MAGSSIEVQYLMRTRALLAVLAAFWTCSPALSWNSHGHVAVTRKAMAAIASGLPDYVVQGQGTVVHCSVDPDLLRNPAVPHLAERERAEHYLDVERLGPVALPKGRAELQAILAEKRLDPESVGFVPYAVVEWTERLALAFAEHRRWPDNRHIQLKSLVIAGILAHYAADMTQPLHTTVHYDGLVRGDEASPRTGIHWHTDALLQRYGVLLEETDIPEPISLYPNTVTGVHRAFWESHALVGTVYELEGSIVGDPEQPPRELLDFTRERARAAAGLVGSLFLTAWEHSGRILLPAWLDRPGLENPTRSDPVPDSKLEDLPEINSRHGGGGA